jgi:transposase, IS5 family
MVRLRRPAPEAVNGYKAHVAADEEGGIVRRVVVTPANVHDSQGLAPVLPARPGRVWADTAYDGRASHDRMRAKRGQPRSRGACTSGWDRRSGRRAKPGTGRWPGCAAV